MKLTKAEIVGQIKLAQYKAKQLPTGQEFVTEVTTYSVRNKRVVIQLGITGGASGNTGNTRAAVKFFNDALGTESSCCIEWSVYPKDEIDHSNIKGTCKDILNSQTMYSNFRDILGAFGIIWNTDICRRHI